MFMLYAKYDPLRANLGRLFVCFVLFIDIKMFYCIIKNDLNLFRSVEMCTYMVYIYIYICMLPSCGHAALDLLFL